MAGIMRTTTSWEADGQEEGKELLKNEQESNQLTMSALFIQ